jgi:hypothetical protein
MTTKNKLYLNWNCSPSSSASLGFISNIPENGKGCPPYAYSVTEKQN